MNEKVWNEIIIQANFPAPLFDFSSPWKCKNFQLRNFHNAYTRIRTRVYIFARMLRVKEKKNEIPLILEMVYDHVSCITQKNIFFYWREKIFIFRFFHEKKLRKKVIAKYMRKLKKNPVKMLAAQTWKKKEKKNLFLLVVAHMKKFWRLQNR